MNAATADTPVDGSLVHGAASSARPHRAGRRPLGARGAPRPDSGSSVPVAPGPAGGAAGRDLRPEHARYVIDGDDLVVTPAGGGLVIFDQFFAYPDDPPSLSVQGGPPVTANELMTRADLTGPPASR